MAPRKPRREIVRLLLAVFGLIQSAWIVAGLVLGILVAMEIGLGRYYARIDAQLPEKISAPDFRVEADGYAGAPWVADYYREMKSLKDEWHPFVYWRRAPYSGTYINIDEAGLRRTWDDGGEGERPRLFMFGGSTLWGTGARDDYTIPSCVARELASRGQSIEVTNFGESSYNSTQEVIALYLELRRGNVPDVVVFYDGVNDVGSAYFTGRAGITGNEEQREAEFQLRSRLLRENRDELAKVYYDNVMSRLGLLRFAANVRAQWVWESAGASTPGLASRMVGDLELGDGEQKGDANRRHQDDLFTEVLGVYGFNADVAEAWGRQYGFEVLFFWQPVGYVKKPPTEYEAKAFDRRNRVNAGIGPFISKGFERMSEDIALHSRVNFHDLSGIFEQTAEPRYVDFSHLTETGNKEVAARMIGDIEAMLAKRPAAGVGESQ